MAVRGARPRWRVRRRAQATVIGLVVLLVGTGVVGVLSVYQLDHANERITGRWMPALVALERLQKAYLDEQTGVRGYTLTGQQQLLTSYRSAQEVVPAEEQVLRNALAADPMASMQLDAVVAAHANWVSAGIQPQITRIDSGHLAEAQQMAAATVAGPTRFDAVRGSVDTLRATLEMNVMAASLEVNRVRATSQALLVIAAVLGLVLAAALLVGLRRGVVRPLDRLGGAVTAVADGHLDQPVAVVGPDEVTTVADAVERMRQALRRHTEEEARGAEREGRLQESERIAIELQGDVVNRLFVVGVELLSIANKSPQVAPELRAVVTDLDGIGRDVREVALGLSPQPVKSPKDDAQ